MFFQEITSITEFPGSNFLLPTIYTGSKWDFQVADLLLATVNFKPCNHRSLTSVKKVKYWDTKSSYYNCPKNGTVWFYNSVMHLERCR